MMNTPFSLLIVLSCWLYSSQVTGQSLQAPKQIFISENYLKEWGNKVAPELRNWVGDSCRHLLICCKDDLEQHLRTTEYATKIDRCRLNVSAKEKSVVMQKFLAALFPKYPLQQMEWIPEQNAAIFLDYALDNIASVHIFRHKDQPGIWDACILFMNYPQVQEYDLSGKLAGFATGVPSEHLRNFKISRQDWHRFFMRHEAAHIRLGHADAYSKTRHQPLICETEADCFALRDPLFASDKHPMKTAIHAFRAMASLFSRRDENRFNGIFTMNHATNIFLDTLGHLERDPEKAAHAFYEVHWKINHKAHKLLWASDTSQYATLAISELGRLTRGKNKALNNLPMYYTAIKILAEQGQFPAGSPEAVVCAEFLEACKKHIAPEYLNTPETRCFYEQCMAPKDVLKKGP